MRTTLTSTSLRLWSLAVIAAVQIACGPLATVALYAGDAPDATRTYKLAGSLKLGGEGGWDYLTLNPEGRLLYVTRSTHTMVVDVPTGKPIADLPGMRGAHGVALVPEAGRGFISDGKDGSVIVFDLHTNVVLGKVAAAPDADAIIYDPASRRVLVFCGDAHQMIAIAPDVDLHSAKAAAAVDLGGSPEFAVADGSGKVYVNIEDKDEVAEIDTHAMKVIARWPIGPGKRPTALAMDRATRRLFIGCRNKELIVMNADSGKVLANFPIGVGVDASVFSDGFALASCADGTLTVIREKSHDKFEVAQTLRTELGARTMAVDPRRGTIYLATSDLTPPPPATADNPHRRPKPIPGTFRILVVTRNAPAENPR